MKDYECKADKILFYWKNIKINRTETIAVPKKFMDFFFISLLPVRSAGSAAGVSSSVPAAGLCCGTRKG